MPCTKNRVFSVTMSELGFSHNHTYPCLVTVPTLFDNILPRELIVDHC